MKDYDYRSIDALFHSRIRLAVSAMLYHDRQADFNTLKDRTGATDGNLSTHLKKMEDAGFLDVEKKFINRKPLTIYRLTESGIESFEQYIKKLEDFIR